MKTKKYLMLLAAVALLSSGTAVAQDNLNYKVSQLEMSLEDGNFTLSMDLDLSDIDVAGNSVVNLVPVLYHGENSLDLRPVGLYSRRQFYQLAREKRDSDPLEQFQYRSKDMPDHVAYSDTVPYQEWMDGASVRIDTRVTGCCGKSLVDQSGDGFVTYLEPEPEPIPFVPGYIYVRPDAEVVVKERSISGEAYVTFKVGGSQVLPDYQNNAEELAKIRSTVESVHGDEDIIIKSITLRGFSSPDGNYKKNADLSQKRTEAIRAYVSKLYNLPKGVCKAESVAENWDGLRAAVLEDTALEHRDQILAIIDSDMAPDTKEAKIKAFKKDYAHLSADVFPLLRRTNYSIDYTVRSYTSTDEIRQVMKTRPQNLSINEFFFLSQEYAPGTADFNEVFAVMARVYPDDETANVNAANAALTVGDVKAAERYLAKAGNGPAAAYTKGVVAGIRGNYTEAAKLLSAAKAGGIPEAAATLDNVQAILDQQAYIVAKRARQQQ